MKIGVWSPYHGTGATASLLAVSVAISEMMERRVLVTQTHYSMNNLEKPLLGEVDSDSFFRDTGLDAIMRFFKSGNLTEEQVNNCSINISKRLALLTGTKVSSKETYENKMVQEMVTHILNIVEKFYDIVLVDTCSGENEQSKSVINECDMVVVNLRQSKDMINEVIDNPLFEGKKVYYLFGSYDGNSKYNLANLRKIYKKMTKENSGGIPHCTQFMDSITDEKAFKFLISNLDADEDFADVDFIDAVNDVASRIVELAEKKVKK